MFFQDGLSSWLHSFNHLEFDQKVVSDASLSGDCRQNKGALLVEVLTAQAPAAFWVCQLAEGMLKTLGSTSGQHVIVCYR
jgi:hypothetical protein